MDKPDPYKAMRSRWSQQPQPYVIRVYEDTTLTSGLVLKKEDLLLHSCRVYMQDRWLRITTDAHGMRLIEGITEDFTLTDVDMLALVPSMWAHESPREVCKGQPLTLGQISALQTDVIELTQKVEKCDAVIDQLIKERNDARTARDHADAINAYLDTKLTALIIEHAKSSQED